jgi:hypothetical protein
MSAGMRSTFAFPATSPAPRVELALRDREGEPWLLTVSSGMERFIGAYPRLPGFDCGGRLVAFRHIDPAR